MTSIRCALAAVPHNPSPTTTAHAIFTAPVVLLRAVVDRAWRLRSWDRFIIPKPFARVDVTYGPLTPVVAGSPREAAEQAPRLQAILDAVPGS